MRIMQRTLLVMTVLVMLGICIAVPLLERTAKIQNQWEALQTERLLESICRKKICSYEEYMLYHKALNYTGTDSVIELEEYQNEQDMDGGEYYYGISWSEIQEKIFTDGCYSFSDGSIVVVSVNRYSKIGNQKKQYYDIIAGKD